MSLWRSGIVWTVLAFLGGLGNLAFSSIISHSFVGGKFGDQGAALNYITFLSLGPTAVTTAVIHYVSHFRTHDDAARLQGLLAGCRTFLARATIAGSVLALILAAPLGGFFHFQPSLIVAEMICALVGLWSGFAVALCQGMGWFKRIAVIGFVAVLMRLAFGYFVALPTGTPEMAVSATTFSLLANVALLYWWKDIFKKDATQISPWNREFFGFLVVSGAYVGGNWFFSQGDSLVATRHFKGDPLDWYIAAGQLGRAIPASVGPLLQVVFTSRSGKRSNQAATDQRILLFLYGAGLALAALCLIVLREFCVAVIFHKPGAAAMVTPFAITMVFVGLNQAIGAWCLASRWFKLSLVYGALGLAYWITLLVRGQNPDALLATMVAASAAAFAVLCASWIAATRKPAPAPA